jgi:photosystem II stability/assembly factor-like uncharacterized protein
MKKVSLLSSLLLVFLASCGVLLPTNATTAVPAASSSPLPERFLNVTNTPVAGTATVTLALTSEPSPVATTIQPHVQEAQLQYIYFKDESSGWAWGTARAAENYLLHTTDGGLHWKDVTPGQNTGFTFFLTGQSAWATLLEPESGRSASLSHTNDGGDTWIPVNQNMQAVEGFPYYSSFGFEDEQNGWWRTGWVGAGTAHIFFYKTRDAGATWEKSTLKVSRDLTDQYYIGEYEDGGVFTCNVCGAFLYFDLSRILYAPGQGTPTALFLTTDLGNTWRKIELAGLPDDINPDSIPIQYPTFFNDREGILPVAVHDPVTETAEIYLYGTQDGGLTWKLESEPTSVDQKADRGARVVFVSRSDGFLGSERRVAVTHDGGRTWAYAAWPQAFTGSDTYHIESQINLVNPTTGWVLLRKYPGSAIGIPDTLLLKTGDGGLTWVEISPVIRP